MIIFHISFLTWNDEPGNLAIVAGTILGQILGARGTAVGLRRQLVKIQMGHQAPEAEAVHRPPHNTIMQWLVDL